MACQAQVDQLYQVRFSGPRTGGGGPSGETVRHICILLSWASLGRSQFTLWPRVGWLGAWQAELHPGFKLSCARASLSSSTQGLSVLAVPLLLSAMLYLMTPWGQAAVHPSFPCRGVGDGLCPSLQSDHPMQV